MLPHLRDMIKKYNNNKFAAYTLTVIMNTYSQFCKNEEKLLLITL